MCIHQAVHPFLFTSITLIQSPSFCFHCSFSPPQLSLSINLPPPSLSPSICLPVPPTHFTLFLSETLLSLSLSPFFPRSIISPHMSASPLFFVTHFPYPTFSSTLSVRLPRPYLSCLTPSLISLCLSALLKYSELNKQRQAPGDVCLCVGLSVSLPGWVSDRQGALRCQNILLAIWPNRGLNAWDSKSHRGLIEK